MFWGEPAFLLEKKFQLPDGRVLSIEKESWTTPEALFSPSLIGVSEKGLDGVVRAAVEKCERDIRGDLYDTVFLAGGSSMFPGLDTSLQQQLSSRLNRNVGINAPLRRDLCVWIGGTVLASIKSGLRGWLTDEEYSECGPRVLLW